MEKKTYPIARIGPRLMSWLLDWVMLIMFFELLPLSELLNALLLVLVYPLCLALLISRFGGTPGELMLQLRVIGEESKSRASLKYSLLREYSWLAYVFVAFMLYKLLPDGISGIFRSVSLWLPYLWVLWDAKRRTLYDIVGKVLVININPEYTVGDYPVEIDFER